VTPCDPIGKTPSTQPASHRVPSIAEGYRTLSSPPMLEQPANTTRKRKLQEDVAAELASALSDPLVDSFDYIDFPDDNCSSICALLAQSSCESFIPSLAPPRSHSIMNHPRDRLAKLALSPLVSIKITAPPEGSQIETLPTRNPPVPDSGLSSTRSVKPSPTAVAVQSFPSSCKRQRKAINYIPYLTPSQLPAVPPQPPLLPAVPLQPPLLPAVPLKAPLLPAVPLQAPLLSSVDFNIPASATPSDSIGKTPSTQPISHRVSNFTECYCALSLLDGKWSAEFATMQARVEHIIHEFLYLHQGELTREEKVLLVSNKRKS